ncbi:MAG: Unknown protein [uncultured Thiotrichaceae bacterium]|uniref:Uncharacterized protein n=1 Tax=uncultured Thiotrichaceae bacterium TaxID=298394 RepID=A0A6S6SUI2_9GAMM|nr:MAG: Unknown protein [uncultured Thiotrichaceae bacterium]
MCVRSYVLVAVSAVLLASCSHVGVNSYEESVKKELQVPHVYVPPNNAYHPFTLLQYKKGDGFQSLCNSSMLTGISKDQLSKRIQRSDIARMNLKKNFTSSFDVSLGKADVANVDAKYKNTKRVDAVFTDGKQISIPGVHLSEAVRNIESSACAADIRLTASEIKDSEFMIPNIVFSYNLDYRFFNEAGVDITAGMPEDLKHIILSKVGLKKSKTSEVAMAGNNLYIGFRGLPLDATVKTIVSGDGKGIPEKITSIKNGPSEKDLADGKSYIINVKDVLKDIVDTK